LLNARSIRPSEQNLEKVVDRLRDGTFGGAGGQIYVYGTQTPIVLQIAADTGIPGRPDLLGLEFSMDLPGSDSRVPEVLTQLRDAIRDGAPAAHYGYIASQGRHGMTAYEDKMRCSELDGVEAVAQYARGAHWVTLLSDHHIDVLGGVDRVVREAPCEICEVLGLGRIYLQLPGDPFTVDPAHVDALEDFLRPVLIQEPAWMRYRREHGMEI
jgi:hypothetical protein